MEEDPLIILLGSELNSIQSYKRITTSKSSTAPMNLLNCRLQPTVDMVHQLYMFLSQLFDRVGRLCTFKRSKRWLFWVKTFYNMKGRVVLPTIHCLIIGTTLFGFQTCVWKHSAAMWTVCSNCSRKNIPLSMGMWECHEILIVNAW